MKHPMIQGLMAVALSAGLSACLFDNDKKDGPGKSLTLTGVLADLDTLPQVTLEDEDATYDVWFLPVDTSDLDQLEGPNCFFTGYLGDSAHTLYSNDQMAGENATEVFRIGGVELYRDTIQPDYTHYRVVFDCFD